MLSIYNKEKVKLKDMPNHELAIIVRAAWEGKAEYYHILSDKWWIPSTRNTSPDAIYRVINYDM